MWMNPLTYGYSGPILWVVVIGTIDRQLSVELCQPAYVCAQCKSPHPAIGIPCNNVAAAAAVIVA